MAVFNLRDYELRRLRTQFAAQLGHKVIGRGTFAAVFDSPKPDRVTKLTADSASYEYLTAGLFDNPHRPQVLEDHGCIGAYDGYDLYMVEVERLQRLPRESSLMTLVRKLTALSSERLTTFLDNTELPRQLASALRNIAFLADNYDDTFVDMHPANFMVRSDGTLVLNDPVRRFNLSK